jgi:HlyD family secretion protein
MAQATYDTALANREEARLSLQTLQSSQTLRADSNEQNLRNADLSIASAELSLERAKADLAATQLLAPFTGVVSDVNVDQGSLVSSNTPVLTLVDDQKVNLIAQIDETEISKVQLNMNAEVTLDAVPDETFTGTVTTIAPVARVENNIPIFDVTLTIENSAGTLRPGMSAEAEILVREVANTVTLPTRAIQTVRGRSYIQVEQADGTYALQPVTLASTSGLNTIVSTVLPPGSRVLIPEAEVAATSTTSGTSQRGGLPFLGGPPAGAR